MSFRTEIENLESEIAQKTLKLDNMIENYRAQLNKSGDFIESLKQDFESSSTRTQQFSSFARLFKKDFTKILQSISAEKIEISSTGHFCISGFFKIKEQIWYYHRNNRTEGSMDIRWHRKRSLESGFFTISKNT